MKRLISDLKQLILSTILMICLAPMTTWGQCTQKITHLSGSQQIGCTTVMVSTNGSTNTNTACTYGPYWIGPSGTGSYTFAFSPPATGATIHVAAINNNNGLTEEVSFEINGTFYPITVPGSPDGCVNPAMITPTGTIGAPSGQVASWRDIHINTTISSIKVEDIVISGAPAGTVFSIYFCSTCCETNAGQLAGGPLHLCPGDIATGPAATQPFLESDDILRYILFSDLNDTLGSLLATSVTPVFPFDAAIMQIGVTYYIAAMAGNNLNGNVDFNDPCLDFSNAIPVTWHPKPAIAFAVADPNVCAGVCTTVTAALTGTAPFTLTYTSPAGGATQAFPNNNGTFQVCPPAGFTGPLTLQATVLTDAWCTCE